MAKFTTVKNGYSPEEVDKYLNVLETKLKGFKEKENAIQNAIVSAQIAADSIKHDASREASMIKENALKQLDEIRLASQTIRQKGLDFQYEYEKLITKYLPQISSSDKTILEDKFTELDNLIVNLKKAGNAAEIPVVPPVSEEPADEALEELWK